MKFLNDIHKTLKKKKEAEKCHHLSKVDMEKLDLFWNRYKNLAMAHSNWWKKITDPLEFGTYNIENYLSQSIYDNYGSEISKEGAEIYRDWLQLRQDMERYLESKNLPMTYSECVWTSPKIGVESSTWNYNGDMISYGFDTGPGKWCSITINGMTYEIYEKRRIQRIESYTKWGLLIGSLGLIVGLISIYISVV